TVKMELGLASSLRAPGGECNATPTASPPYALARATTAQGISSCFKATLRSSRLQVTRTRQNFGASEPSLSPTLG
ncbi:hypothetical protein L0F63_007529, partial [Massospora cicadina]